MGASGSGLVARSRGHRDPVVMRPLCIITPPFTYSLNVGGTLAICAAYPETPLK